jgi:transposase
MDRHRPSPAANQPTPTTEAVTPPPRGEAPDGGDGERHLRLRRPNRDQVAPVPAYLDALLPLDHLARLLWDAVVRLDLRPFARELVVVAGGPGRSAADPALLVALWLYATTQGITRARVLDRLCREHVAYIWLCGGVSVNYHSLNDFRTQHGPALDALMTEVLGHLCHAGLVAFDHVAQDGVRVRASAGAASFRRQPRLEQCLAQAQAVLAAVQAQAAAEGADGTVGVASASDDPPTGGGPRRAPPTARQQAARERAARGRVERLEAALAGIPAARAAKPKAKRDEARVSTTDPEARVMKMADGGYRPAYNFEFAADTAQRVIVGVDVTTSGSDMGQAPGMVDQVAQRCGDLPDDWLMDGGFASQAAIEAVEARGVRVVAPVQTPKDPARDPHTPRPDDSAVIAAWRVWMATDEAKATYKLRAATIECVNAHARGRYGLQQVVVRGLAKVRCVALWLAIAHNLLLWLRWLRTQAVRATPLAPAPAAA